MLEGLHSAAAGLMAQQRRLDAIANDVANVSTAGYKGVRLGFRDLVYQEAATGAGAGVTTGSGAAATFVGRSSAPGAFRQTDRTLDVAISGPGFIRVRRADGSLGLTRDGSLQVSPDGRLRTSGGDLLEPPVTLPRGADENAIDVAPDGTVTAGGRAAGRIELVSVAAADGLQAVGDNLFVPTAASGGLGPAAGARLEQGVLEMSNVDIGDAMVNMMDAQRSFALASKAITMQDEAWGIANGVRR